MRSAEMRAYRPHLFTSTAHFALLAFRKMRTTSRSAQSLCLTLPNCLQTLSGRQNRKQTKAISNKFSILAT